MWQKHKCLNDFWDVAGGVSAKSMESYGEVLLCEEDAMKGIKIVGVSMDNHSTTKEHLQEDTSESSS